MREPRVLTAKRTMVYMSTSLAVTAGGIILGYLLMGVHPVPGKTMNYTLSEMLAGGLHLGPLAVGHWYVVITIASEALLLFVAAQAGFIAGPRVALCMLIEARYQGIYERLKRLDQILTALPSGVPGKELTPDPKKPTAVMMVGGFSGLGIHSLLTVMKLFPRYFHTVVFMSVGVVDSATFQGVEEVDRVREQTEEALRKYVDLARGMGIPADYRMSMGTEAVSECERLAGEVAKEYERAIFFAGKLIFEREKWW